MWGASDRRSGWSEQSWAPDDADLARCVHCGLCLSACPTYLVTSNEAESPRGRIALARAVAAGELNLTPDVTAHWDRCLGCRACESVCPSGVPYGRIIERLRAQVAPTLRDRAERTVRRAALRWLIAKPKVLAAVGAFTRAYAWSPLRPLVRRAGRFRPLRILQSLDRQLPPHPSRPLRARTVDPGASRVAILPLGCVMNELLAEVHEATINVLEAAGWRVATVEGCCGALQLHDGDVAAARKLARALIAQCEAMSSAVIVNDSAGCGAAMKEYPHLFEPGSSWHARAASFAARVRDFSEVVTPDELSGAALRLRVVFQDPCHLVHAQRIREEPRRLLRAVSGLDLAEAGEAELCCGAAGIYGLVQREMSAALRARKAQAIAAASPEAVVTANPGCQLQLLAMAREHRLPVEVLHLTQVLDRALRQRKSEASPATSAAEPRVENIA